MDTLTEKETPKHKKTHLYSYIIIITAKNKTGRGTKGCVFSVVCMSASLCVYSLWPQVKAHAASFQRKVGVCVRKERMRGVEPRGGAIDFVSHIHSLQSTHTRISVDISTRSWKDRRSGELLHLSHTHTLSSQTYREKGSDRTSLCVDGTRVIQ